MNKQKLRRSRKHDRKNTLVFKVDKNKKTNTKTISRPPEETKEYSMSGSTKTDKE